MHLTPQRARSARRVLAALIALAPPALARAADPAELERLIRQQQEQIGRLQRRLGEVERGTRLAAPPSTTLAPPDPRLQSLERRVDELQKAQAETAARTVSEGSFPGSFKIPGSDASIKLGGYVKADLIYDFDDIGSEDLFVTNSIRTEGKNRQGRTRLHARQTRLNVDVRKPSEWGPARAFVEGDFFGGGGNQNVSNSTSFRIRHAFAELGRLTAGQTWSTFMDLSVVPDTLDFEGPNSELFVRQGQFRWTETLAPGLTVAFAVENPEGDFANDGGLNLDRLPDGIVRLRWEQDWGHLQTAFLARELRFDDGENEDSEFGYGLTLSGSLKVPFLHPKDKLAFQVNYGDGIGRYITDLGGGGFDARVDNGRLDTVQAFGVMVQGQHWWADNWRSTLAYGYLTVDNAGGAPGNTLETSHYVAANLVWSPISNVDIGIEYLFGYLETENDRSGAANRIQAAVTWRF
jgi:hypothetical protein